MKEKAYLFRNLAIAWSDRSFTAIAISFAENNQKSAEPMDRMVCFSANCLISAIKQ
jgi:hypothetical protein